MDQVDQVDQTGQENHAAQENQVEVIEIDGQVVEIIDLTDPESSLTPRQRAFIDQYFLCNMNATQAAIAVGCKNGPGIRAQAYRLLHHEGVQAAIRLRLEEEHMSAVELLRAIARDARGLFGQYLDPKTGELNLSQMEADGTLHLVEAVTPTKYGTSYRGPSRQRAQEMLIKILGLARTEHVVSGEVEIKGDLFSDRERLKRIEALLQERGQSEQSG